MMKEGKKKEKSPRGEKIELKAAATTTVGSMKGTAVSARSRDLPRKSNLEKRMAAGRPRTKVRRVERMA